MLRSVKDLEKCSIVATDGLVGKVQDFYFDDASWVVRYLVVDTGAWLSNRKVLISPYSIAEWEWDGSVLPVSITREQVMHSPAIDADKPVSRQHERDYYGYYGYPYYWGGSGLWGDSAVPGMMVGGVSYPDRQSEREAERQEHVNPHLRSCNAVSRYYLHASDGELGHVQGYLVDQQSWAIRFLIVNTSNWWVGHQVLIAVEWIDNVSWLDSTVTTGLSRQAVKDAPAYDSAELVSDSAAASLYRHYGRRPYNTDTARRRGA
jgi:uncharacterized protein YrrD